MPFYYIAFDRFNSTTLSNEDSRRPVRPYLVKFFSFSAKRVSNF